jgi:glyoxylase-like metal-dependent hydrolase (beta-lactamase superfamily II)
VRVYVHEAGAPHMIDPRKLLASAMRLHGDQMDTLWGAFLPLPAASVTSLAGGERLDVAGGSVRVAYTPGHAKHHVSYLDVATGRAYVGDTAGVRMSGDFLLMPTPPPDIDLELWHRSVDLIDQWQPVSLFLTHFGPVTPARAHLARVHERLEAARGALDASMKAGGTDDERIRAFVTHLRQEARRVLSEDEAAAAELAAPFDQLWQGLDRYAKKKLEASPR